MFVELKRKRTCMTGDQSGCKVQVGRFGDEYKSNKINQISITATKKNMHCFEPICSSMIDVVY